MTISSVALLILVPLFVFTFGPMLGEPHEAVLAYFARPCPGDHRRAHADRCDLHAFQERRAGV